MTNNRNILIIEPERVIGLELQNQFKKKRFLAQRPFSFVNAKTIIDKHIPDLIVADISIEKQTTFDRIKEYLSKVQIPFIRVGASVNKKVIRKSDGVNVFGTFSKPFDSKKLIAFIVRFFNTNTKFHLSE